MLWKLITFEANVYCKLQTFYPFNNGFEVLSDVGNKIARQYCIVMDVPQMMRPLYLEWGLDLPKFNGNET